MIFGSIPFHFIGGELLIFYLYVIHLALVVVSPEITFGFGVGIAEVL